jgi:hypothetical protein
MECRGEVEALVEIEGETGRDTECLSHARDEPSSSHLAQLKENAHHEPLDHPRV